MPYASAVNDEPNASGPRPAIVLAADIGGTNSRLALYATATGDGVTPLFERTYPSNSHSSLDDIAEGFLFEAASGGHVASGRDVRAACFAVAGPIEHNICRATNLPWVVDGRSRCEEGIRAGRGSGGARHDRLRGPPEDR